ncbi:hypothetical protein [Bacillus sp. FJAT-42315]|uniref:hypothetical protein n=1 Tax=Bacillus sp. FJAT-42315 TaxID=2014077 RepID=UPI000C230997|nr:hypothetical protein [Bacillus sp. FJAT-42315]
MAEGFPPSGLSVDFDQNGKIDHIFFLFSETLKGTSLSEDDITVEGYTVLSAKTMDVSEVTSEDLEVEWEGTGNNGEYLIVTLQEGEDEDTSATPAITIANNALFDLDGNAFAGLEEVPAFDFAPPVAKFDDNSTEANIRLRFSEDVSEVTLSRTSGMTNEDINIQFDSNNPTVAEIQVNSSTLNVGDVIELEIKDLSIGGLDSECILTFDGDEWNIEMETMF